jgi:xanthine dehydrogenase small subunit
VKGLVSKVEIQSPKNLKNALEFLKNENREGQWKILAGATDLAVEFNAGKLSHQRLINIWGLRKELAGIKVRKECLLIGALTTFTEIQENQAARKYFPNLTAAARLVGGVQIQNRGTLGGNIANASPAGDSLPALLSYNAGIHLKNSRGLRRVALSDFYKGYKILDLAPDEIITAVELPFPAKGSVSYFRKVGTRQAQAISKVVAAGTALVKGKIIADLTFSLGSVGPFPLRCPKVEEFLIGKSVNAAVASVSEARDMLGQDITPRDDIRSTKSYREFVSRSLLEQFVISLNQRVR